MNVISDLCDHSGGPSVQTFDKDYSSRTTMYLILTHTAYLYAPCYYFINAYSPTISPTKLQTVHHKLNVSPTDPYPRQD